MAMSPDSLLARGHGAEVVVTGKLVAARRGGWDEDHEGPRAVLALPDGGGVLLYARDARAAELDGVWVWNEPDLRDEAIAIVVGRVVVSDAGVGVDVWRYVEPRPWAPFWDDWRGAPELDL
jgi:hypothetical protein